MRRKKRVRGITGDLREIFVILAPPLVVLSAHIIRQILAPKAVQYDYLAHLLGGGAIAWSATLLYEKLRSQKAIPAFNPPLLAYFILASVALVGVLWELQEWVLFHTIFTYPPYLDVWNDLAGDLVLDLLGAFTWVLLKSFRSRPD